MKKKYLKIFLLASPFYLKGRSADKLHHLVVAKMMEAILKENPKLDSDVMMAVALLHDIGYAKIPKHKIGSFWAKKVKKDHMRIGAELAQDILGRINFRQGKIERVCEIIATHDNPELGLPIYSYEAQVLKEADILWMTTEEAYWLDIGRRQIQPEEWLSTLEKRFSKDPNYKPYINTRFGKGRVRNFLRQMRKKLRGQP